MALPKNAAEMTAKQVNHGGVDPNVKIPQQILDAGKRSEAIQQAIAGDAEKSVAAQLEENQPSPQGPPDTRDPAQMPDAPPVGPGGTPDPHDGRPSGPVDWERQFKSLNGRAEAEARRAREAITQLSERLEQIEQENRLLKSGPPPPQANGAATSMTLSEEEIADYGPEFVDVMRRVAAETAGPLQQEIQNLRGQLGHVQQETGNAFLQRMHTTIGSQIPNWADLNKDPRFIQWSQLPDIFSGAIRKTLMQEAWNSGDPQRVAAFFQAYLAEEAATNPQGQGQPRMPPSSRMVVSDTPISPPTPGAPLDLASLAAPGRAHSAGGTPAEKPVYTAAEITRFYTDVAAGRWNGRDQQRAAIDQDIMLSQREGRIVSDQRTMLPRDPYMR
jgi:hypothetical protein